MATHTMQTQTQLLELTLGENRFGIDIEYVDEIVERKPLTPIPGSPPHVAGVMDLRGETTRIVDPKAVLQVEGSGSGEQVVILDVEEDSFGWIVDGVSRVFAPEEYDRESMADNPVIQGIVHEDDGFIMWVDPGEMAE